MIRAVCAAGTVGGRGSFSRCVVLNANRPIGTGNAKRSPRKELPHVVSQ